ncbi:hypothetical protein FSP39_008892 [Pinctada imbricata]|uniref:Uncharacterized protein n=1 Tax=Pinctada imbricata TaxID=66713 RepID=A0AA88YN71_PINIB|nr:hypothetical protein FSP39_008892 [Pinctada imbricata]
MPQTTNRQVQRDRFNCPIGPGTVYNSLLDISNATRKRATQINHLEVDRMQKLNKIMERNQRYNEYIRNRVKEKTEKSLQELKAFQKVLNEEYKVDNFKTMELGFKREYVMTPRTARRFKLETRVYHSGFDRKAFRPEINRKIRQMDPTRTTRIMKKILLEKSKDQSDILIDRNLSVDGFYKMLEDRTNLKRYMYGRKPTIVRFETPGDLEASKVIDAVSRSNDPDAENRNQSDP